MLIGEQWGQRARGDLSEQGCKVRKTWGHLCPQVAQQATGTHGKWGGAPLNLMLSPQNHHHQDLCA